MTDKEALFLFEGFVLSNTDKIKAAMQRQGINAPVNIETVLDSIIVAKDDFVQELVEIAKNPQFGSKPILVGYQGADIPFLDVIQSVLDLYTGENKVVLNGSEVEITPNTQPKKILGLEPINFWIITLLLVVIIMVLVYLFVIKKL